MGFWDVTFWLCFSLLAYVFIGYPLLLAVLAKFKGRPWRQAPFTGSVSILLAARNEERRIEERLRELTELAKAGPWWTEVVVVSDGSTDQTVAIAQSYAATGLVRVLDRPRSEGKAAALSAGCLTCTSDVLVFADVRQRWAPDALHRLLENFADPSVGAVSGDLKLETPDGALAGVGLYWRFEKWLRVRESLIDSQVGVTGAIAAVRRELFRPIPAGTLLDDVYWPLQVAMLGYRVVHDCRACAFDRLPPNPRDELRRKVRTLAGNFQLAALLPGSLLPWRNPVWVQWLSRKLLRLLVPWALMGLLLCCAVGEGYAYNGLLGAQAIGYGLALIGLVKRFERRIPLAGAAASFLILNVAAFAAFWVWISGRAGQSWAPAAYSHEATQPQGRRRPKTGSVEKTL